MITQEQAIRIQSKLSYYGAYVYYNPFLDKVKIEELSTEFEQLPSFIIDNNVTFVKIGRIRNFVGETNRNAGNIDTFLYYQTEAIKNFNLLCVS